MAPSSPRKSLTEAFPGLVIEHQPRSSVKSKLKSSIRTGWPTSGSMRGSSPPSNLTVKIADFLRKEAQNVGMAKDPAEIINMSRESSLGKYDSKQESEMVQLLEQDFIALVYGSNAMSRAGSPSLQVTIQICRRIFQGEDVGYVPERDEDYEMALQALKSSGRVSDRLAIFRSRSEVIQHAKALNYAIDNIVLGDMVLTPQIICHIHEILTKGVTMDGNFIGGIYRTVPIAVRYGDEKKPFQFIRPQAVPQYMDDLFKDFHNDIELAEAQGNIDPYEIAARYSHRLVNIHPFRDGNGRLSRILVNIILLKYAGHICVFGEDASEKQNYLEIQKKGSRMFYQEDGEIEHQHRVGHHDLARYTLSRSKTQLHKMMEWAKRHL